MKIGEGCPHSMPRPPERLFKWRHQFPFLAQAAELAAVENQRRRGGKLAQLDLADENHVVAFRVAAAVVAFEPGRRALENGLAGARQLVFGVFPRIDAARGELL